MTQLTKDEADEIRAQFEREFTADPYKPMEFQAMPTCEMRLPESYGEAVEFVARSWWRRTLIKFISGGRIEFFSHG